MQKLSVEPFVSELGQHHIVFGLDSIIIYIIVAVVKNILKTSYAYSF